MFRVGELGVGIGFKVNEFCGIDFFFLFNIFIWVSWIKMVLGVVLFDGIGSIYFRNISDKVGLLKEVL